MATKKKLKKKTQLDAWEGDPPGPEPPEESLTRTDDDESLHEAHNLVLYLDEDDEDSEPVIVALVAPDLDRCQCEWSDTTTTTFGPRPVKRCVEEPTVIAFQKRQEQDTKPTGAISLCDVHRVMVEHMYPGQCYFRQITTDKKIGDFA